MAVSLKFSSCTSGKCHCFGNFRENLRRTLPSLLYKNFSDLYNTPMGLIKRVFPPSDARQDRWRAALPWNIRTERSDRRSLEDTEVPVPQKQSSPDSGCRAIGAFPHGRGEGDNGHASRYADGRIRRGARFPSGFR